MRFIFISLITLFMTTSLSAKEKWELREEACALEYKHTAERLMCNDRQLTRMDAALNESYLRLKDAMDSNQFQELRETQRTWLNVRNRCEDDYQCVFVLYQGRNGFLEQKIAELDIDYYLSELYAGGPISCAQWSRVRTQNENEPKQIRFVNKSDGGRSVSFFTLDGTWNEVAWLEQGESYTVSTYMTQPWMFTDGPGNCIEMYMPHPEMDTFELRIPTRFFGGEND